MSQVRAEQQKVREQRVRELAAEGITDWAISQRLGISKSTVANIRKRLGVKVNWAYGDVWGVEA